MTDYKVCEVRDCPGFGTPHPPLPERTPDMRDDTNLWQHPDIGDWRYEVANGDTMRSFAEWLDHRAEIERDDAEAELDAPDSWDALSPEARTAWLQGMRFNDDGSVATPPDPDLGGTLVGREHPDFEFVAGKPVTEMHEHDLTDDEGRHIAHVTPATADDVFSVLFAPIDGSDGRSAPVWVRLANGDLLLGVFPQGDTYISIADKLGI